MYGDIQAEFVETFKDVWRVSSQHSEAWVNRRTKEFIVRNIGSRTLCFIIGNGNNAFKIIA